MFAEEGAGLRVEMLPVPTNANVLAILDRIMRRIARRLAPPLHARGRRGVGTGKPRWAD